MEMRRTAETYETFCLLGRLTPGTVCVAIFVDPRELLVVGVEVSANSGIVFGNALPGLSAFGEQHKTSQATSRSTNVFAGA